MAEITKIDRSKFVSSVIKTFTDNRIGQFSKYLDADPIFVTYYAVNMAHSRADLGTDAIADVLGAQSPIRYNKIEKFPIYIRGGLEPETNAEDGAVSNEMELNDITILPMTLTPRPFDHILIELPNMVPVLLRVNNYRNLTIQSNDFYSASAHAIEFGKANLGSLERLVIEKYTCIFENIGTQNSCFIRSDMYDKSQALHQVIEELKGIYNSLYYNQETNSYIFNSGFYTDPMLVDPSIDFRQRNLPWREWGTPYGLVEEAAILDWNQRKRYRVFAFNPTAGINRNIRENTIYDLYLTKFIMDSRLFFTGENYDSTTAVVYEDLLPAMFETNFKRTLWYAVMTKSATTLFAYPYFTPNPIRKEMSSLMLSQLPHPLSVNLLMGAYGKCCGIEEYFSHELLHDIKNGRTATEECKCNCDPNASMSYIDTKDIIDNKDKDFNKRIPTLEPYTITKKDSDSENEPEMTEADKIVKVLNDIIYGYFNDSIGEIDTDQLIAWLVEPSFLMFEYAPIIIYILTQQYNGYFEKLT